MHFDILVEDQSGEKALEILVPKIIGTDHTYKIRSYKGIGRLPTDLVAHGDPSNRILLDQLPRLLQGFGKTHAGYGGYAAAVIVVCDLDNRCLRTFRNELLDLLNKCSPKPETRFCIAIEEGEAWLLGDIAAIKSAYPNAKETVLNNYHNDAICGTWELLANALYNGGANALKSHGWQAVGAEKSRWGKEICQHMNIRNNKSPSFVYFRTTLSKLAVHTN